MIPKIQLKTVIIAKNEIENHMENKEVANTFWKEIEEQFECFFLERNENCKDVLENSQIDVNSTLYLGDDRQNLLRARALGMAVLACEGSNQITLPLEPIVKQEDHSGFEQIVIDVWETDATFLRRIFDRERRQPWEIVRTNRLLIREEWEGDLEAIYEMYTQDHITRFLEKPYPEKEKELDYIRKYRKYIYGYYGYGLWHLVDLESQKSAGRAGLNPKTYEDGVSGVELGYMITKPFLRKGYCMEACEAIMEYAHKELGLERLFCLIEPENEISIRVAEKLDFHKDCIVMENGRQMLRFKCEFHCKSQLNSL